MTRRNVSMLVFCGLLALATNWSLRAAIAQEQAKEADAKSQPSAEERLSNFERRLKQIEESIAELLRRSPARPATSTPPATGKSEIKTPPSPPKLPPDALKSLSWRSIGPANMGGRITDLAVYEKDPSLFWVATASGGLLKTTNNGTTFEHQFDHETTVSIGAVAVAPSDANVVWVGTGEANPRNSVSFGDGVYKSVDGGKKWKNMGLKKSYQIGRILVHPTDPNIVYVGALGRLYGPSDERGLYKTVNGGETWERVLFVDDRTGVIDAVMHPAMPDTVIVAMWERLRDGYDSWPGTLVKMEDGYDGYDPIKKWGAGGIHKTTDGGKSFKKLAAGLPGGKTGRIGLDVFRKDPNVLLATIDCENIGKGPLPLSAYLGVNGEDRDGKATVTQVIPESPADKAGVKAGDVIETADGETIEKYDMLLDRLRKKKVAQRVKLAVKRGGETKEFDVRLAARPEQSGQGRGGIGQGGQQAPGLWFGGAGETRDGKSVVLEVVDDSPAGKAGIKADDVILEVDGKPLAAFNDMIAKIRELGEGDKLKLKIKRGEETKEVELTLTLRPSGAPEQRPPSDAYLGLQGRDAEDGARLIQITDEGPAEKAGLEAGDVVKEVDGKKVANYAAFTEELNRRKAGDKLKLTVLRGEELKIIEATMETRPGGPSATRPYAFSYGGQSPNIQDMQGSQGKEYGGIYKSIDCGETWQRVNSLNSRPMYFSVVKVDPVDDNYVYALGVAQYASKNGGATFQGDFGQGVHADGHAMWIDPRDGRHMIHGGDGGVYVTWDRGATWDHLNHAAIGQFYHVAISPKAPYAVTGGLQDNGTWFGPSLSKSGAGPINEDWLSVAGGDGFMCRVDQEDPDVVYYTSQNGRIGRRNLRTGELRQIYPVRPRGEPAYRFNWNAPFMLSSHNSRIFYSAANYVFRSFDRGNSLHKISPELTLTKRGSATALSESPLDPNVLYAGTDDGALWVTKDGGQKWEEVSKNLGLPAPRWVATLEASRFVPGRVYACLDGHRSDDDEPYAFVSEDFGKTWKSLRANLPWGSTRCLREDLENRNLLFLGTEFGLWCTVDRGLSWNKLNNNLPTVAVHEVAIHPANGEIIAATHGRSLWIANIAALRQISPEKFAQEVVLYKPATVTRWQTEPARGRTNRRFVGTNPERAATLYYSLPAKAENVSLKITDVEGATLRELRGPTDPGLNRVSWDLARVAQGSPFQSGSGRGQRGGGGGSTVGQSVGGERPAGTSDETPTTTRTAEAGPAPASTGAVAGPGGTTGPGGGGFGGPRLVAPGVYRVTLIVDGKESSQTIRIERDPSLPADVVVGEEELPAPDATDESELTRHHKKEALGRTYRDN